MVAGAFLAAHFPSDAGLLGRILGRTSRPITAHACVHCGHLQLAIEFTDQDRKRYQKFEGPRRSITEE